MKYNVQVTVNIPREKFLDLFENIEFMKKWQAGFASLEVLEGEAGEEGSKNLLTYWKNKKETIIIESIIKKKLPDSFDFLYETKYVMNWVHNTFIKDGESTIWKAEHKFKFIGYMKAMILLRTLFVKQTVKDMNTFKSFAEKEK
jgi:hypothetical protein